MKKELKSYVGSQVFPTCKFIRSEVEARKICGAAEASKDISLPENTTVDQFVERYYKSVDKKLKNLRVNTQTSARIKFMGKLLYTVVGRTHLNVSN